MKSLATCLFAISSLLPAAALYSNPGAEAEKELEEQLLDTYQNIVNSFKEERWSDVIAASEHGLKFNEFGNYKDEIRYMMGVASLRNGQLLTADRHFSVYLDHSDFPKHFEEVLRYKFDIAETVRGAEKFPWFTARDLPPRARSLKMGIKNYGEVASSLPNSELASKATFGKGWLEYENGDYSDSVETFEHLIKYYPRDPLVQDAYVAIMRVYLTKAQTHYADPDYYDLARINLERFHEAFGKDEKTGKANALFTQIQEVYAKDLYETAQFYDRTKKPKSSKIYYTQIIDKYPDTITAEKSRKNLVFVEKKLSKIKEKK